MQRMTTRFVIIMFFSRRGEVTTAVHLAAVEAQPEAPVWQACGPARQRALHRFMRVFSITIRIDTVQGECVSIVDP